MELKTLRTFVAVAELRNFSAAARQLLMREAPIGNGS